MTTNSMDHCQLQAYILTCTMHACTYVRIIVDTKIHTWMQ